MSLPSRLLLWSTPAQLIHIDDQDLVEISSLKKKVCVLYGYPLRITGNEEKLIHIDEFTRKILGVCPYRANKWSLFSKYALTDFLYK